MLLLSSLLLASLVPFSAAVFEATGQTVTVNGIPYYAAPDAVTSFVTPRFGPWATGSAGLVPVTVVTSNALLYTTAMLNATISSFEAMDDVYHDGFLEGMSYIRDVIGHPLVMDSYVSASLNMEKPLGSSLPSILVNTLDYLHGITHKQQNHIFRISSADTT
ncbi:hypothetical protein MRB53_041860 [Persea americana]|nr:hypothetical protein MRB53_041860 [Persea americana]